MTANILKTMAATTFFALAGAFATACATPAIKTAEFECTKNDSVGKIHYTYDKERKDSSKAMVRLEFDSESPRVSITDAEPTLEITDSNGWACTDSAGKPVIGKLRF